MMVFNILIHKTLGDKAALHTFLRFPHDGAESCHVLLEFLVRLHLLFQIPEGFLCLLNVSITLVCHSNEIPVRDPSRHIVAQELGLLLLFQFDNLLLGGDFFLDHRIAGELCMHSRVFGDQSFGIHFGILEHFQQNGLQFTFVQGDGVAGMGAVLDFSGADPFAVDDTFAAFGFFPIVGSTAAGAVKFAGKQVLAVADILPVFDILTAAAQDSIGLIPKFFGNDSRDNFSGFILEHHPFFRREEFLLLGEHIDDFHLVAHIVTLVFWVGNHVGQGGMCNAVASIVPVTLIPENLLDLLHRVFSGGVKFE